MNRAKLDFIFLSAAGLILLAGLSTLYSISVTGGENILSRQLVALLLGGVLFLAAAFFDYRMLASYARSIYVLALLLLAYVLFFAAPIRGVQGWLSIAGFNFQPVELAKIALILILAKFFAMKKGEVKSGKVLLHSAILMILPVALVIGQPDLGSAVLLFAAWFCLLFFSPVRFSHIVILFLIFIMVASAGWYGFLADYQKERFLTFLDPGADPQGSGYNVRQSVIAVGSGQIWGRGLGKGFQSHLKFLPEKHTDFIFASFAEEMGFLGAFLLIVAFGILFWRIVRTALRSPDSLGMYLCLGVAALIAVQVFINIGMNIGLMPVTGITLPMVSYGGSSLIMTMFLLGLVQSVYRRSQSAV